LERVAIERLRRQFDVNVFGALAMAQEALRYLPEREGRIVFVGSIAGRLSIPYVAPYSASKFALRALADALRLELAPSRIGVSLIEPGSVDTPIWRKGRAAREVMEREISDSHRPHYREAVERTLSQTLNEERSAMPVERVAGAIAHAVKSAKPRPSYLLGAPARVGSFLAILPHRLREYAMRASFRFP
jgi:NAD(P)-dependent dehydrogenase (short-subunit alcohol dehydrogenase family)